MERSSSRPLPNRLLATWAWPLALLAGCATFVNGSTQTVHLRSQPPGAEATVGDLTVVTPAALDLSRRSSHLVRFRKSGYEDVERTLHQRTSGYVLIDWMFGAIPALVDYATGGAYELEPALLEVRLNEEVR